jgi:hypothetical protein
MKVSAIAFVTLLTLASAVTAHAAAQLRTGTAFEIAQQYANGGKFGGVTSGTTGTALEIARDSMNFLGAPDRVASAWPAPRVLAQGD